MGRALGRLLFASLVLTLISGCATHPPQPGQESCWKAGTILGGMARGAAGGFGGAALTEKLAPRLGPASAVPHSARSRAV